MKFSMTKMEQDIMNLLWSSGRWLSGAEFWDYFNNHGKICKRQTVNTYLVRMTEKGLLIRNGKKYMYAYSKEEFSSKKAWEVLDTMYNGSIKNFVTALTGGKGISKEDADEIRACLDSTD